MASADAVVPVGARTQWEAGGPAGAGRRGRARRPGIARYEPDDLTITVGAGHVVRRCSTPCSPSTARSARSIRAIRAATVGGILACGLSGIRRLRHGPLRDHVLEVRFVTATAGW